MRRINVKNGFTIDERDQILLCKYLTYYELVANKNLSLMPYKNAKKKRCEIEIKDNFWKLVDGLPILFMQCVICKEFKPKLSHYYCANYHDMDFWKWFSYDIGTEMFKNAIHSACNTCCSKQNYIKTRTNSKHFWKNSTLKNINSKMLKTLYDSQTIGPISGISMMYIKEITGHILRASIHDIVLKHKVTGEKYSQNNHNIEDCVIDLSILNVSQRTHIVNLMDTMLESYKACHTYYINPELFLTKQNDIILKLQTNFNEPKNSIKTILRQKGSNYMFLDKKVNRFNENVDKKQFLFDTLMNGKCICSICKVPLTIKENKWTDVSFDRLDNSKGHFVTGNLRIVCMLHQITNNRYITHDMFMHMLYIQQHFPIDDDVAKKIETIHNRENCPFCEIQSI